MPLAVKALQELTTITTPIQQEVKWIKIGNSAFIATLFDKAMVTAFKSRLPMTVNMIELNGNEKYFDLPKSLPTNASNPGTVQNGDLMLYGANTLVLFIRHFRLHTVIQGSAILMMLPGL